MSTTASRETLAIVLAHGKALETCRRHAPVWLQNAKELFYFTPADNPFPVAAGMRQYSVGYSKAYSADTNLRCREALRFGTLTTYKYILLIEYDSLIFGDIPLKYLPPAGGVSAPLFHNNDPKFQGKFYFHFPQLFTRSGAKAVVAAMDALPLDAEHGFTDRYVGLAVATAQIPYLDLNPTGFVCTHNEIDAAKLPEVLEKYKAGARWSHGVKTPEVFEALQKASTC